MPRPNRVDFPGATFHVLSRGVAKTTTFRDDVDRRSFLDLVTAAIGNGTLEVHAYCLMPNHFHLLVTTPTIPLGPVMQRVLGLHAQRFNWRHERVGHLWQGRYGALLVEDDDYFLDCSRYIHLNPVRAGLAVHPAHYLWSSYSTYGGVGEAENWVSVRRTLSLFGHPKDYREFVTDELPGRIKWPSEQLGEPSIGPIPGVASRLLESIKRECNRCFPELSPCRRRRLLVYVLRHREELSPTDIAGLLERSRQSVHEAVRGIRCEIDSEPSFGDRVEEFIGVRPLSKFLQGSDP